MDYQLEKIAEEIEKHHLTDTHTIKERKHIILKKITLDRKEMDKYQNLLIHYRYVDEVDELRPGSYIRFFKLNTDTLELGRGGFLADIQLHQQRIVLLFKNRNQLYHSPSCCRRIGFWKNKTYN